LYTMQHQVTTGNILIRIQKENTETLSLFNDNNAAAKYMIKQNTINKQSD
jgi:hypothetical protein